jgi:DNA polymerase, archaea type
MPTNTDKIDFGNQRLYGRDSAPKLLAVEYLEDDGHGQILLYSRAEGGGLIETRTDFKPFVWLEKAELAAGAPVAVETSELEGEGPLRWLARVDTMDALKNLLKYLKQESHANPTDRNAPYFVINNPVQQYLMLSGKTLFKSMVFGELKRMQVDIETHTAPGFDFPNASRPEDRIVAIALADSSGWTRVLSVVEQSEKEMLAEFVAIVRERDPDTIEGHNIFNFDLPYIFERASQHKLRMALGRDGSVPSRRNSRMSVADRTLNYQRFEIFGRHVVDTLFLAQLYDISSRSLQSYGLKPVAIHFGVAAADRTYIPGHEISAEFERNPERVLKYAEDDIVETRAVSDILSPIYFAQTQMLPLTYQDAMLRGNAMKIDALLLREYLAQQRAIARPDEARSFSGGYTDIFITGVRRNVHHCDIPSLYPSLMIRDKIVPASDELNIFLELLTVLRDFRVSAKQRMRAADDADERNYLDALQSTFKILINSFYGYLGFSMGRFNDFDAAERVAAEGRKLLKQMIEWIDKHGGEPVEIDTDGIYFVPPDYADSTAQADFEQGLQDSLPKGITVEFDGRYRAMFSYKMKNYALLSENGEMIMRGAALKSRGLERFQRTLIEKIVRMLLEGRDDEIDKLKAEYLDAIKRRKLPITDLAKSETLRESPQVYRSKIKSGDRGRNAAYELALAAERDYSAGDQISYYVTGDKKSVAVHSSAKLVADWDPDNRDENVPYYQGKVEALFKKFQEWIPDRVQGELF